MRLYAYVPIRLYVQRKQHPILGNYFQRISFLVPHVYLLIRACTFTHISVSKKIFFPLWICNHTECSPGIATQSYSFMQRQRQTQHGHTSWADREKERFWRISGNVSVRSYLFHTIPTYVVQVLLPHRLMEHFLYKRAVWIMCILSAHYTMLVFLEIFIWLSLVACILNRMQSLVACSQACICRCIINNNLQAAICQFTEIYVPWYVHCTHSFGSIIRILLYHYSWNTLVRMFDYGIRSAASFSLGVNTIYE